MVTLAAPAAHGPSTWWVWLLGGVAVWFGVAALLGVLLGKGIRRADQLEGVGGEVPAVRPARARRRALPVPTFGLALLALAVTLETVGYVVRLAGDESSLRALSMDAPLSLPRMYVAALFAAAALAAVAGAAVLPGRRTWWLAVGAVAGGIATVKAGGTIHARALLALDQAIGVRAALAVSIVAALAVIAVLWFLSRSERRDRRRVLGVLALYAVASVGLSAVSGFVAAADGDASTWAVTATFLEEAGEAIAAVTFLLAVLAGVAPRVALPGNWALRRADDAHTLAVVAQLPVRSAGERY